MSKEKPVKKSLWILHYAYERRPEMKIQPFYAIDEADAQEQVRLFVARERLTISEQRLLSATEGFQVHNTELPGTIYEISSGKVRRKKF